MEERSCFDKLLIRKPRYVAVIDSFLRLDSSPPFAGHFWSPYGANQLLVWSDNIAMK